VGDIIVFRASTARGFVISQVRKLVAEVNKARRESQEAKG
jgi:tRNA U38,U39,U40 pseudouridine synthase TruA